MSRFLINTIHEIIRNSPRIAIVSVLLLMSNNGLAQTIPTQDSVRVSSTATQTDEDGNHSIRPAKSPRRAMLYSALFPGMGQLYNGKKFKALVFFCTEFGLMSNSIYLNQKYVSSTNELDRDFYLNNRNLSTWYLLGAVLFSSIDAFVDAHLSDFDESSDLSLRVNPVPYGNGLVLNVAVNF